MQSMSSSNASSSNLRNPKWINRVFISFDAKDVEEEPFIFTLYAHLKKAGIRTCFDPVDTVRRRQETLPSRLQAIERSRLSVVIFSKGYAGSTECLVELENIMDCHRVKGHIVFPVFYGVNLWNVRKQKGEFGALFEGMVKNVHKDRVLNWRRALSEAAFFPGCRATPRRYRHTIVDFQASDEIVHIVCMMLDGKYLSCTYHQIGKSIHTKNIYDSLSNDLESVHLVGIWGKGGSGKTTIAKVIYNNMCHSFEGSIFLANIKDEWKQDNGKEYLQKQLLTEINSSTDLIMNSTEMEKILPHKRVLVVLDDVSQRDQLISLCGSPVWFGPGSMILITAREKHLLDDLELDFEYEMKGMESSESLQLFGSHAFKNDSPAGNLIKLSKKAISHCGGLPLALEVLGSLLLDRKRSEWKSILKLLKRNQSNEVLNILKVSYDFLDHNEKKIFIEIACFYIGMDRHNITQLLNGCGLAAETGISKLIELSLLKVDMNNKLEMHDLFQDMGSDLNDLKPKSKWIHNVFLSFRGVDTRRSFTSHLYATLQNAGMAVYMDDNLERGENISSSLLQAIEVSRVSIIIFSINYANSRWCLQELEKIMECHRTLGQEVLPVFYGVEPSEVRNQIGSFGKALGGLVQRISDTKDMIISWKRALTEAANLSGWNLNDYRDGVMMHRVTVLFLVTLNG
ncbi:disease resistance protein RUN1-like isoform X2 [Lotus japonicus]|uniref:disease resistance protein RUN1-like isoform X2 n=1 Tax=Lotus japonicus TaxID=34305 RepID=UPI00258A250A|nr:disease resistance protein RUN1-like isoform X2 [Lotus japonicus]